MRRSHKQRSAEQQAERLSNNAVHFTSLHAPLGVGIRRLSTLLAFSLWFSFYWQHCANGCFVLIVDLQMPDRNFSSGPGKGRGGDVDA